MSDRPVTPANAVRRRVPGEFFGLERLLWEDRNSGQLAAHYLRLLDQADAALSNRAARPLSSEEADRIGALRAAIQRGRIVLQAARQAMARLQP